MTTDRLWAKSVKDGETPTDSHTLPGHLKDVYRAARAVLAATAEDQLRALGLGTDSRQRLERCVLLAAACHDLGKSNSHFIGMLNKSRKGQPQGLRHEWVSLLLMLDLRDWLRPAVESELDWQVVLWAVGGHHPAYGRPSPPRLFVEGGGRTLEVYTGHRDFTACLDFLRQSFHLAAAPTLIDQDWPLVGRENVFAKIFGWYKKARADFKAMSEDDRRRRFVAAVKSCLIGADIAGSVLPRKVKDNAGDAWIAASLARRPTPKQLDDLITARLTDKETGQVGELRQFQRDVAEQAEKSTSNIVFVKAGCGSGKTLAAYHWARTRWPGRRIYFCYPTTGTATEGFRDYLFNPDEKESKYGAELFHGRAWIDLNVILGVKGDETREEADGIARIESLDAWSTPIVSCTVDTVLGLVQNNRRGLYAWPALAGAVFVFDEIHAYDDRLFGALLRFLQALPGVPVLLMTASLPCARLEALRQCLGRQKKELLIVPGPLKLEQRKRYHRLAKGADPLTELQAEIERGGKVLWVCNTVARVMAAAKSLSGYSPKIYHSRFRYMDRVERHKDVVNAFQRGNKEAVVACCSQVAELSLDLHGTTLLLTELAPVPALIQRLGRLARQAEENDPTRPFLVVEPMNDDGAPAVLPYTPQELEDAKKWLETLGNGPLSQTDLAEKWEEDTASRSEFVSSAWLDGGPSTPVLELREASPGLTVVLDRDWSDLKNGTKSVTEVALPMPPPPRGMDWRKWPEFKGVPVAPPDLIDYDAERGAQWGRS